MAKTSQASNAGPKTQVTPFQRGLAMMRGYRGLLRNTPCKPSTLQRIVKTLLLKCLSRSDYRRWTDPRSLELWWDSRTEQMARLIPKGARVIEFGAGRRSLESFLDKSCTYVPSDLIDRGPGTIICDLNKRPLPDVEYLRGDVAFFAGVLEYVRDLESVIEWLSAQVSICIASYVCASPSGGPLQKIQVRLSRAYFGYMNSYTEGNLLGLFSRYGFVCTARETWTSQRIFVFVNQTGRPSSRVVDVPPSRPRAPRSKR